MKSFKSFIKEEQIEEVKSNYLSTYEEKKLKKKIQ
jgi:hypothetical protein